MNSQENSNYEESADSNQKISKYHKGKKFKIIIAISITIIIIACVISAVIIKKHNDKVKAEREQAEAQAQLEQDYYNKYKLTYLELEVVEQQCEAVTSTVSTIWYKSIHDGKEAIWSFNDNIQALYSGDGYKSTKAVKGSDLKRRNWISESDVLSFRKIVSNIKDEQTTLDDNMKDLNSPPDKYKDVYNEIISLYNTYEGMYNQAMSPTGTYSNFNSDIDSKKGNFSTQYKKIQVLLPGIEE